MRLLCMMFLMMLSLRITASDRIEIPDSSREVASPLAVEGNAQNYFVKDGGMLKLGGEKNTVFVEAGGSVFVTGNRNVIYVANKGALILEGTNNKAMVERDALFVTNKQGHNLDISFKGFQVVRTARSPDLAENDPAVKAAMKQLTEAFGKAKASVAEKDTKVLTPTEAAIASANKLLTTFGEGFGGLMKMVPLGVGADFTGKPSKPPTKNPAHPIQGGWEIVQTTTDDMFASAAGVKAVGHIYFQENGMGILDARFSLNDQEAPWKQTFRWKDADGKLKTSPSAAEGASLEWNVSPGEGEAMILEWTTPDSSKIKLVLKAILR